MAYNYYPAYQTGYNNYFPAPYQPVQQPVQQTAPVQQSFAPSATQQNSIIWISGEQEAQMYPIAPNNAVALWAKDGKTIYLKSADATGKPTLIVYDLVERNRSGQAAAENTESYATKSDLTKVVDVIAAIKTDIDTIKGDMYGIAGKKKSVKKVESDDDE